MNENILLELAARWESDAVPPVVQMADDSCINEYNKGQRESKKECADTLRTLISMLGRKDSN